MATLEPVQGHVFKDYNLFMCPLCKEQVTGNVTVNIIPTPGDKTAPNPMTNLQRISFAIEVVSMAVAHQCTPPVPVDA